MTLILCRTALQLKLNLFHNWSILQHYQLLSCLFV